MEPNFPPGKLPGHPDFTDKYYKLSQGAGETEGPWNSGPAWDRIEDEWNPLRSMAATACRA